AFTVGIGPDFNSVFIKILSVFSAQPFFNTLHFFFAIVYGSDFTRTNTVLVKLEFGSNDLHLKLKFVYKCVKKRSEGPRQNDDMIALLLMFLNCVHKVFMHLFFSHFNEFLKKGIK